MSKIKKVTKRLILICIIASIILNKISPFGYCADKTIDYDANRDMIVEHFRNAQNSNYNMRNDDLHLDKKTYAIVSTKNKDPEKEYFHLDLAFRTILLELGGIENLKDYIIVGGNKTIDVNDTDLTSFIDETIDFYENYGSNYADPKDVVNVTFDSYMSAYSNQTTKLMYINYTYLLDQRNSDVDKFADKLSEFIDNLETPLSKYIKQLEKEEKEAKEANQEYNKKTLSFIKSGSSTTNSDTNQDDISDYEKQSINDLTKGDSSIAAYENSQSNVTQISDIDTGLNSTNSLGSIVSFMVRKVVIFLANVILFVPDGIFNIFQSAFLPGTPTAVKKRIYSPQLREIADNLIPDNGYYYAYYNAGRKGSGIFIFKENLPTYVNFELRNQKYNDEEDLQVYHPEWFGDYSRQATPLIMFGPTTILSNSIPMFDVNFFSQESTKQNPILELSKEDYVEFMINAEVPESAVANGSITTTAYNQLNQKYSKIYDDAKEAAEKSATPTISATYLKKYVSKWYVAVRNIAILLLLLTLVYTGIRIMISNTGTRKAKYKQMLTDWLFAVGLVATMHFIMVMLVNINDLLISTIKPTTLFNQYGGDYMINMVRFKILAGMVKADFASIFGNLIVYIFLAFYTAKFTFIFIKRVFYMAMLTILSPLIGLSYSIDKIADGKSQALDFWFKEYIFNLLEMPIYLIVYTMLVSIATDLSQNPLYVLIVMFSLNELMDSFKYIFNIKFKNEKGKSQLARKAFELTTAALAAASTGALGKVIKGSFNKGVNKLRQEDIKRKTQNPLERARRKQQLKQNFSAKELKRRIKNAPQKIRETINKRTIKRVIKDIKDSKFISKVKIKPKYVYKGARYILVGSTAAAAGAIMFANGIISGDFENATLVGATTFMATYSGFGKLTDRLYDYSEKEFQIWSAKKASSRYSPQPLAASNGPSLGQPYANKDNQNNIEDNQALENIMLETSQEWFEDQITQTILKRDLLDDIIDTRKEDIKLLHLAGIKDEDIAKGLEYMDQNPHIEKDTSAVIFKNLNDIQNVKTSKEKIKLDTKLKDELIELKAKKDNEQILNSSNTEKEEQIRNNNQTFEDATNNQNVFNTNTKQEKTIDLTDTILSEMLDEKIEKTKQTLDNTKQITEQAKEEEKLQKEVIDQEMKDSSKAKIAQEYIDKKEEFVLKKEFKQEKTKFEKTAQKELNKLDFDKKKKTEKEDQVFEAQINATSKIDDNTNDLNNLIDTNVD